MSTGNEGLANIPQISRTEASPSDGLVSYPGKLWGVVTLLLRCSHPPSARIKMSKFFFFFEVGGVMSLHFLF